MLEAEAGCKSDNTNYLQNQQIPSSVREMEMKSRSSMCLWAPFQWHSSAKLNLLTQCGLLIMGQAG